MNNREPTNADILETLQEFSRHVDEQFFEVKTGISVLKTDVASMKSQMVTKDYLDIKLADQFSDIVKFMQRRVPGWVELGEA